VTRTVPELNEANSCDRAAMNDEPLDFSGTSQGREQCRSLDSRLWKFTLSVKDAAAAILRTSFLVI